MLGRIRRFFAARRLPKVLATSGDATKILAELFRSHGLPVKLRDGWVSSDSQGFKAQARLFTSHGMPPRAAIQLDVEAITSTGRCILESFAGVGDNLHEAIRDAIRSFSEGSFHVIFSALTGRSCAHCELETWSIGDIERQVFIGPVTQRGARKDGQPPPIDWFPEVEARIKTLSLDSSMHWIRFYHGGCSGSDAVNEVLLDNTPSLDLRTVLATHTWPEAKGFHSVRLFLIIAAQA